LKHVPVLTAISLALFNVISLSAQKQVYRPGIADSLRHADSVRALDSHIVEHFVQLSHHYLITKPDSSLFWADTAIEFAAQKNNWELLNRAYQARKHVLQYDPKKIHTDSLFLETENELRRQRSLFLVATTIILIMGTYLGILLRQKIAVARHIEKLKSDTQQKDIALTEQEQRSGKDQRKVVKPQEEKQDNEDAISSDIKERLILLIAHDIRSPLASLQNTLSLARENILNAEEFRKLTLDLEADINTVQGMLDNMLLWTREQFVEIKINPEHFDLGETTSEVIAMHRVSLIKKNITVHNNLHQGLPAYSDKEIVSTIFRNVFSNAVKFTEENKNIYLNYETLPGKIFLSVKDEGRGIGREILDRINNKQHISTRGTAGEKGTGIGLMFSTELLNKLGEEIDIKSAPGAGTTVTFSIQARNEQSI